MLRLTLCAVLLAIPALRAEDKAPEPATKARELKIEKKPEGKEGKTPVKVTSAEELAKAVAKETADEIAKQVDFKNEYVVIFSWSGSGGDKLAMDAGEKEATFKKTFGRTRDLRPHFHAYALPKGMTYKTGK